MPINTKLLLEYSMIAVFLLSLGTLVIMWRQRVFRDFAFPAAFLIANAISESIDVPLLYFRRYLGIDRILDYKILFCAGWTFFVLEYILILLVIYGIFRAAMRPFSGLQHAGKLVFRWVFGLSFILACILVCSWVAGSQNGVAFLIPFHEQIHQAMGILALCLLLFVTFSLRYMGLTFRSRLFGISLGVGMWAVTNLAESALLATTKGPTNVYSPFYLCGNFGYCLTIAIWGVYFFLPEPERKLVLLPTTSSFFFWNRLLEALERGHGEVTVTTFAPEMLAKGEREVLTAATRSARTSKIAGISLVSTTSDQSFAAKR